MQIQIKLDKISYGDAVVKVMPALCAHMQESNTAAAKIISAIAALPESLIRQVFEAIPPEEQNEILSLLVQEHQDIILSYGTKLAREHGVTLSLANLQVTKALDIRVGLQNVDYVSLVNRFYPLVEKNLASSQHPGALLLRKLPVGHAERTLKLFPSSAKEHIIAYLLTQNSDKICAELEKALEENGLHVRLRALSATV